MAYIQVEASVRTHKKFLKAGPAASWLWLCGMGYCQEQKTDIVPLSALRYLGVPRPQRLIPALVASGLWQSVEGGWKVIRPAKEPTITRTSLRHLMAALAKFWGRACAYCGCSDALEVEHIVPLARGGT